MEDAYYLASLAKAFPNLFTGAVDDTGRPLTAYAYILDHLPLARGHALLHVAAILEGNVMVWPDPKLSRRGRWWLKVRQLFRRDTGSA